MSRLVYLDNNATTQVDLLVEKEMRRWQTELYGNPSSLHFFGREVSGHLDQARRVIAESINCQPDEIIFTASGSEGNNLCIKGYCEANAGKGKHIVTSLIEHPSVINSCSSLEKAGFEVTYLPVDEEGFVSAESLEKNLRDDTILVSIMHANNEIGTIQKLSDLSAVCRKRNVFFHTDAVQSFLKVPFDVKKLGVDLATFCGHKIHAPKGVGFIFKSKDLKLMRQIDGGGQEFGLRAGTENIPYIMGLAKAVELFSIKDVAKIKVLQTYLIDELLRMKGIHLNGPADLENRICNNINISVQNMEGEFILSELSNRGICVSTGSACSAKSTKVSPVLMAIGCPTEFVHGNIRVGISKFTTREEVDLFLVNFGEILKEAAGTLNMVV